MTSPDQPITDGQERPARLTDEMGYTTTPDRLSTEMERQIEDTFWTTPEFHLTFADRAWYVLLAEIQALRSERDAWKARASELREALIYSKYMLETVFENFCECEDCEQCGKSVDECSGTECAQTCNCSPCGDCQMKDAIVGIDEALAESQPPTAERHAYDRACRNTQHSGCTCMHLIDGRWCGKSRYDPIHDLSQPPCPGYVPTGHVCERCGEAPENHSHNRHVIRGDPQPPAAPTTADHPWFVWLPSSASVHRQCCDRLQSEHPEGEIVVRLACGLEGADS